MTSATAERALTILFRLNAGLMMMATFAIFLPVSTMAAIHQALNLGEFPETPISDYLARSCSMLYAVHGTILMVVSFRMRQYWTLVGWLIGLHAAIGICVLGIDLHAGMPWYWTALEGPGILVFAGVLFWLWRAASDPQHRLPETQKS